MTALYTKPSTPGILKGSPCQQVLSSGPTEDWFVIWVEKQTNRNYTYTLCKEVRSLLSGPNQEIYLLQPACHEDVCVSDYVEANMAMLEYSDSCN